ncbi:MAG: UpxY family transcription antiterminator [Bacteroides sp.]|nr:UpxY family transcription antiterminator [Bacteroides sp.]
MKRRNSNTLAIHELKNAGLQVFTPMTEMILSIRGRQQRREVPVIQDLLFAYESKDTLDKYVQKIPTLQYRYLLGKSIDEPMTVRKDEMDKFIYAITTSPTPLYFNPGELTDSMYGKRVKIIGGLFDQFEGQLLSVKGMRKRRLIIGLQGLISAAVEVEPEFIQIIR